MIVGVPKETMPGDDRVALIPATIPALTKTGLSVLVETRAGERAGFLDAAYREKGAEIAPDRATVFQRAEVILQVRALGANPKHGRGDLELMRPGQTIIGHCDPLSEPGSAQAIAERKVTLYAMELMPRITRAQSMDSLSSGATVAGYAAVLLAANTLPKMFPMFMTAAGTITPARVFIIGAGVAGLQAIATAKRLGAVVHAYDVRPAVREQVESLGGKFVEIELETTAAEDAGGYAKAQSEEFLRKQRELMGKVIADSDVVITTAAVPGKKSPLLVTEKMVEGMAPGSVIIDLAAERGGNCELTRADEEVVAHGVTILGPTNLAAKMPYHASQMYSKNVTNFLTHMVKEGKFEIDPEDEIPRDTLVARDGEIVNQRVKQALQPVAVGAEGKDS
jgi:NAD(P) transhydrogenase subunit alpha